MANRGTTTQACPRSTRPSTAPIWVCVRGQTRENADGAQRSKAGGIGVLRVGFGRVDITPAPGLRLAGSAPYPRAEAVAGPLHGCVLLADDGARRVGIVCLDLLALPAAEVATLRTQLAAAGGRDPAAILVACSHTHRAPFT
ncbi:MAG: hypothetical protein M3Q65_18595, partial [Chloroflexota bacterium]|nr:hypothetical protein [Chloroflexota bacterium]